jgi:hypothetical protein
MSMCHHNSPCQTSAAPPARQPFAVTEGGPEQALYRGGTADQQPGRPAAWRRLLQRSFNAYLTRLAPVPASNGARTRQLAALYSLGERLETLRRCHAAS